MFYCEYVSICEFCNSVVPNCSYCRYQGHNLERKRRIARKIMFNLSLKYGDIHLNYFRKLYIKPILFLK